MLLARQLQFPSGFCCHEITWAGYNDSRHFELAQLDTLYMDWNGYNFSFENLTVGDTPPVFFVEVILRTTLLYLFALLLVRILGKRGLGQLSPYEFVVLIAMGSALGDPMFYPNVAMLPPMLVLVTIVILHRSVSLATQRHKRLEIFIEGEAAVLLRDGKLVREAMDSEVVSFDELGMLLRQNGIENLAAVRFATLEPSGKLSVFTYSDRNRLGLPLEALLPESGVQRFGPSEQVVHEGQYACLACGNLKACISGQQFGVCPDCPEGEWVAAKRIED